MELFDLKSVPSWLGAGIVSAAVAALAYVFRIFLDWIGAVRERHRQRRSALVQLQSLLRAAKASFDTQQKHVRSLFESIPERDANAPSLELGYEDFLTKAHPLMTAEERERHGIIRGYTEHVLRPTNAAMLEWIKRDTFFGSQAGEGVLGALAKNLAALEIHLLMWNAKYEVWIPGRPDHALVYLDDEEEHGIAFPHGIDSVVDRALAEMK